MCGARIAIISVSSHFVLHKLQVPMSDYKKIVCYMYARGLITTQRVRVGSFTNFCSLSEEAQRRFFTTYSHCLNKVRVVLYNFFSLSNEAQGMFFTSSHCVKNVQKCAHLIRTTHAGQGRFLQPSSLCVKTLRFSFVQPSSRCVETLSEFDSLQYSSRCVKKLKTGPE